MFNLHALVFRCVHELDYNLGTIMAMLILYDGIWLIW